MPTRDGQDERFIKILGDLEKIDSDESIDIFFEYLKSHLSLPCEVTGIEDFGWEEIYILGPGNKKEYEILKKKQPSFTDKFVLIKIVRQADSWWALHEDEDIGACVRRISDEKSKNYELLDDYSVWFVNNR